MAKEPANRQPDPTPEEIAERAAEIRAGWSPRHRDRANVEKPGPVTAPVYTIRSPKDREDRLHFERID